MTQFLIRRFLWAIFLFVVATIITYLIFWVIPTNPAQLAAGHAASPEYLAQIKRLLHLDRPIWMQYYYFVENLVVHGSLGESFVNRQSVDSIIGKDAPVTASLVFGGAIFWLSLSIPVGILSALRPRSVLDRITMTFVLIGISAHPVWIGLILSFVIGYKLHITPIAGYCNFFPGSPGAQCEGPAQWAYHMILPWVTFMILFAALYVRLVRANVMETMNEDYVRTARAKGASQGRVMVQHVLRNSLLPVVTILGMDLGLALGGAIFTESIFNLPGIGREVVKAYGANDLPIITGVVVFSTLCVIVFNLIVDLAYGLLDPRIRPS
ncbi:MAG TPA: ABC transporter permease [Gaiellaceae bacterium]|jgi:peptide/nickel transport system permease protein